MPAIVPYTRQTNDAPGLGFQPQQSTNDPIAQGLGQIGAGLGNLGDVQAARLRERDSKMRAAQSALALATYNNDLRDEHDRIAQGVQTGEIAPADVGRTFDESATKLRDRVFEGLSPDQQASIQDNVLTATGGLRRNLNVALFQRSQSEAAGTIDAFSEQAQRMVPRVGAAAASEKFAEFVDHTAGAAGLSPEKATKLKQSFAETVHYNAFQTAGVDALTRGDVDGLADIRKQLASADGDPIDPVKRAQLTHQLFGYEEHVRAKLAAAANAADSEQLRRNNEAGKVYNDALDLTIQGKQFEPAFIKQMTEAASGTVHQDAMVELLAQQSVVSGFATKTAPERTALLERLESRSVTTGTNPAANKLLTSLRTLSDKVDAGYKENPWATAQSTGVIADARAFDAAKPDSAFSIVQQRSADIAKVELAAGHKVSPFQPQEIVQLAKAVGTMPPEQQAPYLGRLGEVIGDNDRINLVADDLDKKNRPLALALKLGTDRTTAGRVSSEFVLRGAQALADKTVKRDETALTGWRADIAAKVRGTLGDAQFENDVIDAAYYTRAAMDVDGAKAPGYDLKASTDLAIQMVVGSPMERAGVKTILPRGYSESMFDAKLKTLTPASLAAVSPTFYSRGRAITAEQLAGRLSEFGMRRAGGSAYIPVSNGAPITTDEAGANPLRIRIE